MVRKLSLFLLLIAVASVTLAQNSSKSKSKERFREKDDPTNRPTILNAVAINSPERELAPAYYENGIVFLSNRNQRGDRQKNGETYLQLYFAPFDPNGNPAAAQGFSFNLNSTKNEGPVTFSRDFQTIYYTQNNNKNGVAKLGKDNVVHLKIYWAKAARNDWKPQGEMPFCSDEYDCQTPSLSIDGKRMYFTSNKPGGYGGYDLYYVDRDPSGTWTEPVNVGPGINTDQNDMSPCITQAGTLFFASSGHNSLGRRDLFYANATADGFGDVVNLNSPFNTEADESSIVVNFEGNRGFFVSDRGQGNGKPDIYAFTIANGLEGVEKPQVIPGDILVVDARTGEPLQGATIHLLPAPDHGFSGKNKFYQVDLVPMGDQKNVLHLELVRKDAAGLGNPDLLTNAAGRASTDFLRYRNYIVLVAMAGFQTVERLITTDAEMSGHLKFTLETGAARSDTARPRDSLVVGSVVVMDKIFNGYDKAALNYDAVIHLDALYDLLLQYPEMEIDLVVHTDTRGDAKLNQELSNERAKNAETYLRYRGIAANRIRAYGRGASEPRTLCQPCTDDQNAENSRIEIKVRHLHYKRP